jgi:taurine dioxygenase
MQVKLLSVVLGAEIDGINLRDTPAKNFEVINNLLLEHKVLFFRNQNITSEEQIALAKCFAPLERHAYVKCRDKYPEIVRIIKGANEKHQWGETWHIDVSYNVKPTKPIVLRLIKISSVGGDSMFSNMELAWDTLDEKDKRQNKKALRSSLAIWYNRSVIHQGLTDFFPGRGLGYERIMDRIAIEGDRPN